tara:strand:- start:6585 stop:6920 length:336 start_codon:yes stop_codon:yes gene_type:complete
MPIEIPLKNLADYTFTINLDSFVLLLRLRWNSRESSWRLDINTVEGVPIVGGLKLLADQVLTRGYISPLLPSGNFFIIDIGGGGSRPTFNSLGNVQKLIYLTKEEEDELRA